jgi:hypothetical protein
MIILFWSLFVNFLCMIWWIGRLIAYLGSDRYLNLYRNREAPFSMQNPRFETKHRKKTSIAWTNRDRKTVSLDVLVPSDTQV